MIVEGVYWPGIPSDVIKRAVEFKRRMESDNERSAFLVRSRAAASDIGNSRGEVRIVHTSAGHHGDFEARALYNVVLQSPNGGKARIIRFDESGAVVVMADERPSGTDSPKHQ